MADAYNVTRLGQVNQAGDEKALFLKVFAGEVLTAFKRENALMDKHLVRTIKNGKSASFPVTGKIGAEYHTPGNEITGLKVNHAEKVITIDDLLVSHAFIADIDEAMNHYDVRSIYSTEMGRKLSNVMDENIFAEIIKTARITTPTVTDGYAGTTITNDKFKVDGGVVGSAELAEKANALAEAVFQAAQALDEKDAPKERYCFLRPAEYYALVQDTKSINRDWGGAGSYADGNVLKIAGVTILMSNNIPKSNTTAANAFHGVDASKSIGVVFTREAVGTVKLMDLSMQSDYQVERQGTLMVARYAVGHGSLRPECAVELALDTLTN